MNKNLAKRVITCVVLGALGLANTGAMSTESCQKHFENIVNRLQPAAEAVAGKSLNFTVRIISGKNLGVHAQIYVRTGVIEFNESVCNIPQFTSEMKAAFDERLVAHEMGHAVAHHTLPAIAADSDQKMGEAVHEGVAEDFGMKISRKAGTYESTVKGLKDICEFSKKIGGNDRECVLVNQWEQ